ncbi:MAG: hypothetical protein U0441_34170 [Polyangiaceae bacterium]
MSDPWVEGFLSFDFDGTWHAVKWDDSDAYRSGVGRIQKRAVDFCGVRRGDVYLIEVKDFRGHAIANKPRLTGDDEEGLASEVAHKVCDTIAGLVGARRMRLTEEETFRPFGEGLASSKTDVRVILWLEADDALYAGTKATLADRLKRKLRWLTSKVSIASTREAQRPPGLTVTNLKGAGQGGAS